MFIELLQPVSPSAPASFWANFVGTMSYDSGWWKLDTGGGFNGEVVQRNFPSSYSRVIAGARFKQANLATGNSVLLDFYTNGNVNNQQIQVRLLTNGNLDVTSGASTVIGSHAAGIVNGQEFEVEVDVVIHATTGSVRVRLDGVEVINLTNVNTNPQGTGSTNGVCVSAFLSGNLFFKKYYALDPSIAPHTDFLFDEFSDIYILRPAADGDLEQYVPDTGVDSYARINGDGVVGPGSVTSNDPNDHNTYVMGVPAGSYICKAVNVVSFIHGNTNSSFRFVYRRSGSNSYSANFDVPSTIFPVYRLSGVVNKEPNTNQAWEFSEISDGTVQFGHTDYAGGVFVEHLVVIAFLSSSSSSSSIIKPSGIASTEAFGTPVTNIYAHASAIASTEGAGTPVTAQYTNPAGIASSEASGSPLTVQYLHGTGIAATAAFGTAQIALSISPGGIASTTVLGTARAFKKSGNKKVAITIRNKGKITVTLSEE